MPGILPSASNHPVWSPIAGEIHSVIWDRVGLEIVRGFVREWASNWNAKNDSEKVMKEEPWQALNPALPLPPSPHSPRTVAEKWASLAALHDVYDSTGETVLPWPLPEDDRDLIAFTEWIRGDAGAYQLLMRKAFELPPDCERTIRRWLSDVCKSALPKPPDPKDISQRLERIEAAVSTIAKSKGRREAVEAKAKKKQVEKDICIAWEKFRDRKGGRKEDFLKKDPKADKLIRDYFRDEMKRKKIEVLTMLMRIIERNRS
jgi:hypothetical protein